MILLGLLSMTVALVAIVVPTISGQVNVMKDKLPLALNKLQTWTAWHSIVHLPNTLPIQALSIVTNIVELITIVIFVLFLSAFLAYNPDGYRQGLRLLVPRHYEKHFDELWKRLTIGLKHWVGGIFIDMLIMGTMAGVGLWIAGIDGAATLALLTFFGTFVPYLGAIVSAVPGLLMGLAKSPEHLAYAAIVYLAVHFTEGYIVSPYVMKHAIQLKPALLLFWQALMLSLFGVVGIIVATPLLAGLKAFIGYIYIEYSLRKEAPKV